MFAQKIETGEDRVHDATTDFYGKRLATALSDHTIKIHAVNATSSHLATLTGHTGPVWRVSWAHPSFHSIIASCGHDGKVIIWEESEPNSNRWTQSQVFTDHNSSINSICWAPYELGLCLASGSSNGSISVFTYRGEGAGWDTTRIERAHPVGVTAVSWAPAFAAKEFQGELVQKIVSGGFDNSVRVWKMSNGSWRLESVNISQVHKDWVRDVAWSPALVLPKSTIASCSQDGTVAIWTKGGEGEQWRGKIINDFGNPVWRVSWGLVGRMLSITDGDGNVMLWKEGQNDHWEQVTKVNI